MLLTPEQIEALQQYDFPGNVRELFNLLERAGVLDKTDFAELVAEQRLLKARLHPTVTSNTPDDLEAAIRKHVRHVYEKYDRNLTRAAKALKIARNTAKHYLEEM